MVPKVKAAIIGYGNIGKFALEAIKASPDFELGGIVRSARPNPKYETGHLDVPIVSDIRELKDIKVALLTLPTRLVPQSADEILAMGINIVDSYDIHGKLADYKNKIDQTAREHHSVGVISAGWDPGTDSMIRCMFEFMAPQGITYTNLDLG